MKTYTMQEVAESKNKERDAFVFKHLDDLLHGRVEFHRDVGWIVNIEDIYCEALGEPEVYKEVVKESISGEDDLSFLRAKVREMAIDAIEEFYNDAKS